MFAENFHIEFYHDTSGCFKNNIYDIASADIHTFAELDDLAFSDLFDHVIRFESARRGIVHLSVYVDGKREIFRQFIDCNWSCLDDKIDITSNKLNFENVKCKHKGHKTCPYDGEGVVCIITNNVL